MINFDDYVNENKTEHNLKWPYYSRSSIQNINNRRLTLRKNKCIIKLINNQTDINKTYLYAKDPYEAKYEFLINKRKNTSILMILKLLLNTQITWKMCIRILKNTI